MFLGPSQATFASREARLLRREFMGGAPFMALAGGPGGLHGTEFMRGALFMCDFSAAAGDLPLTVFAHGCKSTKTVPTMYLLFHDDSPWVYGSVRRRAKRFPRRKLSVNLMPAANLIAKGNLGLNLMFI
jgi:hypothetical protein